MLLHSRDQTARDRSKWSSRVKTPPRLGQGRRHAVVMAMVVRAIIDSQCPVVEILAMLVAILSRGQWGDDGYDTYGEGQHRGSSSSGGGRGYAWQSDGTTERPFYGPLGGFLRGHLA